jgi:Transposase
LLWAVEDCRQLSRRLERDLLAAGQRIVRVPPKLMTNMRDAARSFGKSDPIDALAVARAALREPDLPVAHLDGPERDVRLLVDHREDLVAERTRIISRLRWHLHELDPSWQPTARSLDRPRAVNQIAARLEGQPGLVARLARELVERLRTLNADINALAEEITTLVGQLAPSLVAVCGCGPLTAAKILGETAGIRRLARPAGCGRVRVDQEEQPGRVERHEWRYRDPAHEVECGLRALAAEDDLGRSYPTVVNSCLRKPPCAASWSRRPAVGSVVAGLIPRIGLAKVITAWSWKSPWSCPKPGSRAKELAGVVLFGCRLSRTSASSRS